LGIEPWLGSFSTHLKAGAGGWKGRPLHVGDELPLKNELEPEVFLHHQPFAALPWKAQETVTTKNEISYLIGSEWSWMNDSSKENFQQSWYQISNEADRMGYRLAGASLVHRRGDMVSSAVSSGTVQLLPNGQLIILMADHQTTGGYPRIAHVIGAHLPLLAQKGPNDVIRFQLTTLDEAEDKLLKQYRYLSQLATASGYRLREPGRF
jgi:antagonist of KipI